MIYISFIILFISLIFIYIKIARFYNFFDIPNSRSSHNIPTVRGGGIIFPISIFFSYYFSNYEYTFFFFSLIFLSIISFIDDIYSISNVLRLIVQIFVSIAIIYQLEISLVWWSYIILLFVIVGGINCFNFMDGINGLTSLYSLVYFVFLLIINYNISFVDNNFLIYPTIAVLAFSFFNFRKKAHCFCGDIGSISIGAISLFLMFKLVFYTENISYVLLLLIYALDSGYTILIRVFKKHNIFQPHREHLYQKLVDSKLFSHLSVSIFFSVMQLIVNLLLINFINNYYIIFLLFFISSISYIFVVSKFNNV